jgi:hypothetical protein
MKCYIDDFVEDLNYRQVILYIGNVDLDNLRSKMKSDNMGHMNRLATVTANHLMYVENCDLQDVDTWHGDDFGNSLLYLMEEGYAVYPLQYEPESEKYFIEIDLGGIEYVTA